MSKAKTIQQLNADYQPLGMVNINKAIRLLVKGKAVVQESDPTRGRLRDWEYPKVIRLVNYVKIDYKRLYGPPILSKHHILKRDDWKCAYCGRSAKTIDHVHPKSRGGPNSWMNLVAACFPCNNKKDNKTPEEANMKFRADFRGPYVPTKAEMINK